MGQEDIQSVFTLQWEWASTISRMEMGHVIILSPSDLVAAWGMVTYGRLHNRPQHLQIGFGMIALASSALAGWIHDTSPYIPSIPSIVSMFWQPIGHGPPLLRRGYHWLSMSLCLVIVKTCCVGGGSTFVEHSYWTQTSSVFVYPLSFSPDFLVTRLPILDQVSDYPETQYPLFMIR